MMDADKQGSATAHIELVDHLPGGRTVYPVEIEGELVWLVLRGEMSDKACSEMNEYLAFITGQGLWLQNWDTPAPGPTQLRRVS